MRTKTVNYFSQVSRFKVGGLASHRRRWRIVHSGEIEILPGDRLAVHMTQGTGLTILVLGEAPSGVRGGLSGTWIKGRAVACAHLKTAWIRDLFWKLVEKMAIVGDEAQRLWAAQELLDGKHREDLWLRRQVQLKVRS